MLVVDVLVGVILLVAVLSGIGRGLIASLGTLAGLIAGGIAVYWFAPILNGLVPWPQWRAVLVVAASVAILFGAAALGSALGGLLRRGVDRAGPLKVLDRLLGGAASLVIAALATSLVGASVAATGIPTVSSAVASSRILVTIDALTPNPIAAALAQLRGALLGEGLPSLGILIAPGEVPSATPVDLADPELQQAAQSVARIAGTAYACGLSLTGTGFVIAPDRVVTNAHVVAGVDRPVVELPDRGGVEGRIVYFDAVDDIAVIAVDGLDAGILPVTSTLATGTAGVVQGYPFGGPFTQAPAQVLSVGTVSVPDIYDETTAPRSVYALAATVQPGDSGGPLLTADGEVAGIVFARADDGSDRGYAMTMEELSPVVAQAATLDEPVSSGRCAG